MRTHEERAERRSLDRMAEVYARSLFLSYLICDFSGQVGRGSSARPIASLCQSFAKYDANASMSRSVMFFVTACIVSFPRNVERNAPITILK